MEAVAWRRILALAVFVASTHAADSPEEVARKVKAAHQAKDDADLARLAALEAPDAWKTADHLCAIREFDAARAFAAAALTQAKHRKDLESLGRYVEGQRTAQRDPAIAAALRANTLAALLAVKPHRDNVQTALVWNARGRALLAAKRYREAVDAFRRAAETAERIGWYRRASVFYDNAGRVAGATGQSRAAVEAHEHAVRVARLRGAEHQEMSALLNLGAQYSSLDETENARESLTLALALARRCAPGSYYEAAALGNLGNVYGALRRYPEALEALEGARALFVKADDERRVAIADASIARLSEAKGDFRAATIAYSEAIAVFRKHEDQASLMKTLGNLGNAYKQLGEFATALGHYEEALAIARSERNRPVEANTLSFMATLFLKAGDTRRAREATEQALDIFESVPNPFRAAIARRTLGEIETEAGRYDAARSILRPAVSELARFENKAPYGWALVSLAEACRFLGRYDQALKHLAQAHALFIELGQSGSAHRTLSVRADTLLGQGKVEEALDAYRQFLAVQEDAGARQLQVSALTSIAKCEILLKRPKKALAAAQRAAEVLPAMTWGLSDAMGATARERYAAEAYGMGYFACVVLKDPSQAFHFVEAGRAGTLLETLRLHEAIASAALPPNLYDADVDARASEKHAFEAFRKAASSGDDAGMRHARDQLAQARRERARVIERIQREAKRAATVMFPQPVALRSVPKMLGPGEVLIVIEATIETQDAETHAFVIRKGSIDCLDLGKVAEINAACRALQAGRRGAETAKVEARLRELVIEPLQLTPSDRRLIISPTGALAFVPFSLLEKGREIVYVPSVTTYSLLRQEGATRGSGILAFGDPDYKAKAKPIVTLQRSDWLTRLLESRKEAKAVGKGSDVLLGTRASETEFRRRAGSKHWRAIHLACHGLIDSERPVFSSLALAPSETDDGLLTISDLFQIEVKADLVVLSACCTALGTSVRGEGVMGLTRAFMFAGAPRVIVSLWKVDDKATRVLMVKFYELWKGGEETATALKKAQEFVRDHPEHPEWKHPYYWAAWQLWGLGD